MAARRWRTTYVQPIVAPPPKHPIMYPTPKSADGTDDTPLPVPPARFSETEKLGIFVSRQDWDYIALCGSLRFDRWDDG